MNSGFSEKEEKDGKDGLLRFWVDLHVHTVLSPCAELDMGAPEIVARCREEQISVVAATDHNHAGNAPALRRAAEALPEGEAPLLVLSGMEVQSMEDIHTVLIFACHEDAHKFQDWLWLGMRPILNDENTFGYQLVIDHENNVMAQVSTLLIQGVQYSVDEIARRAMEAGALVIPAHLDRPAFSYESVLGQLPSDFPCSAIELSPGVSHADLMAWKERYPNRTLVRSSDAHKISEVSRSRCTPMLLAKPSFDEIKLALQNREGRKVLFP
jgi:PHP family Zn ribbon phosphoesterase